MKETKIQNSIIVFLFLLVLFVPIISINREEGKISESEQRYLATFPVVFGENGKLITQGLRSGLENWLNDNIGFRDTFVRIHSNINYKILKKSSNEKVEIGVDGWFFYTLDDNLRIANGTYPLTNEILINIKNKQEKIKEYYNKQGIEYVLVIAPSKVSIYPEYINSEEYSIRATPIDIVSNYLKENSDVKVINLKDSLLEAKAKEQVYFKTDTHWNEVGAYIGYQTVINKLNKFGLVNTKPVEVMKTEALHKGEFSAMMGDKNLLGEERTINTEIVKPKAESIEIANLGQAKATYAYRNAAIEGKKLLLYGDSMFGLWNIPELFAENFTEFTYVWSYEMLHETAELLKPDIVMYEITERYLNMLGNFNEGFVSYNLKNPDAEIITHNTPTEIKPGEKYDINIKVKNLGDENWSEDNFIRLCIWQDGVDHGYRIMIPDGIEIKPGEEYTFVLDDFQAPPTDSTYLEFQMLQEGRVYFGERQRVDITVK